MAEPRALLHLVRAKGPVAACLGWRARRLQPQAHSRELFSHVAQRERHTAAPERLHRDVDLPYLREVERNRDARRQAARRVPLVKERELAAQHLRREDVGRADPRRYLRQARLRAQRAVHEEGDLLLDHGACAEELLARLGRQQRRQDVDGLLQPGNHPRVLAAYARGDITEEALHELVHGLLVGGSLAAEERALALAADNDCGLVPRGGFRHEQELGVGERIQICHAQWGRRVCRELCRAFQEAGKHQRQTCIPCAARGVQCAETLASAPRQARAAAPLMVDIASVCGIGFACVGWLMQSSSRVAPIADFGAHRRLWCEFTGGKVYEMVRGQRTHGGIVRTVASFTDTAASGPRDSCRPCSDRVLSRLYSGAKLALARFPPPFVIDARAAEARPASVPRGVRLSAFERRLLRRFRQLHKRTAAGALALHERRSPVLERIVRSRAAAASWPSIVRRVPSLVPSLERAAANRLPSFLVGRVVHEAGPPCSTALSRLCCLLVFPRGSAWLRLQLCELPHCELPRRFAGSRLCSENPETEGAQRPGGGRVIRDKAW